MSKKTIGLISPNNPLVLKRQIKDDASASDEEENHDEFLEIDREFGFNNRKNRKNNNNKKQRFLKYENSDEEFDDSNYKEDSVKSQKSDDDTDMFADLEDEKETKEKSEEVGINSEDEDSNNVKLMDLNKFQEQIGIETHEPKVIDNNDKKSRFDEVEYIDEEYMDDNHEKKNYNIKFTSFGLFEEMKEGRFDKDENFIRYESDTEKDQDSWLTDIKQDDIRKAKREQERVIKMNQDYELRKNQRAETAKVDELLESLITELKVDESCMELLKKLNSQIMNVKRKHKMKKQGTLHSSEGEDLTKTIKLKIKTITEIVDKLSKLLSENFQQTTIYELTREELIRKYEQLTGQQFMKKQLLAAKSDEKINKNNNSNNNSKKRKYNDVKEVLFNQDNQLFIDDVTAKQWEFKWIGKEDKVYGPYSTQEIQAWKKTYYQNRVVIRNIHDDGASFINIQDWEF